MKLDAKEVGRFIWSWVHWGLMTIISAGLLGLLASTVAARYGFTLRLLPPVEPIWLLYVSGALFLYRGDKLW
jgi:hypothetical protein